MTIELPVELLLRPAGEGARRVVMSLLQQGHHAAKRLYVPEDAEALHDFRVAIRRTRAALASWSDRLPRKAKRSRRELTRIQRATGAARDAEVALEWLNAARTDAGPDMVLAIDWLAAIMDAERKATMDVEALAEEYEAARHQLFARVRIMEYDLLAEAPEDTFAQALSVKARLLFEELAALLSGVTGPHDTERMHDARIVGKSLRYLVEPIEDAEPLASTVLKRMKSLQDLLGELHDAHVLTARIGALRVDIDDFSLRTAIDSVRSRSIARGVALHGRLAEEWIHRDVAVLREDVEALANELSTREVEIERKYLLSGMPELPVADAIEIEQGYVPGSQIHERVRRTEINGVITYYRTIKMGKGVQRIEIEEETTREIFQGLWALTVGKRVRKRRHRVPDGDLVWEIDQFLDRDLVLAEVELPSADLTPPIPAWLSPRMIEDVTDRGDYTNLALAR